MTQLFDAKGNLIGCTAVEVGPCTVLQKKSPETDGYHAVQLGFGERKAKHSTKPLTGHCKKANAAPARFIREYRTSEAVAANVGDKLTVKEFQPGQFVDVIGTSKGKGFQGVVFRHKFGGGPMTHGNKGWKAAAGRHRRTSLPGPRVPRSTNAGPHGQRERDDAELANRAGARSRQCAF